MRNYHFTTLFTSVSCNLFVSSTLFLYLLRNIQKYVSLTKRKESFRMKENLHSDRKKKRERLRQRCGYCQQLLSHTQYHHQRRLYYNSSLEHWETVEGIKKSSVPDVPGSSSSESESKGMYQFIIKFTLLPC